MTYKLFEELLERKTKAENKEFLRTGMIASAVVNFGYNRPEKPVKPMDFVPGQPAEVDLTKLTPEEQAEHVMNQMFKRK